MKIIKVAFITLVCLLAAVNNAPAQRYLSDVFSKVDSIPDIQYGIATNYLGQEQQLLLDFYQPRGDKVKKRPLMIYVHGGGFQGGSYKQKHIRMLCERMALKGYAVASVEYRLDPTFPIKIGDKMTAETFAPLDDKRAMTDAMHDAKAAVRFFKAKSALYKIDTANIVIGGESAGAITAMMATYVNKPGELAYYPKANPNTVEGDSGNPGHSSRPKAVMCLCGFMQDTLAMESPKDPNLLWIHGSKDPMAPITWGERVTARAKSIKLPYRKYVFEGATHCPWYNGLPDWRSYLDTTVTYISKFMYNDVIKKPAPGYVKKRLKR